MFVYKVLLDPTGYNLIEAEYFYITKDTLGNRDACFCVVYTGDGESPQNKAIDETVAAATVGKEVLVAYVRNPVCVQLDTVYEAKPHTPGPYTPGPYEFTMPGAFPDYTLDIGLRPGYRS